MLSDDIKQAKEAGKLVIGERRVLRMLKQGKLSKVVVASNAKESLVRELRQLCDIANVELVMAKESGFDLGALCKRSHNVSLLGFGVKSEKAKA